MSQASLPASTDPGNPDDIPDAEVVAGAEIVRHPTAGRIETQGSTALIEAPNAADKIKIASEVATALNDVIVRAGLRTKIGNRKKLDPQTGEPVKVNGRDVWEPKWHPNVEAWETLGTLLGVAVRPHRPEPVVDPSTGKPIVRRFTVKETSGRGDKQKTIEYEVEGHDWLCYAEVFKDGIPIGSGTGVCSRTESSWHNRDEHSVSAMAQTRAIARAMRTVAAWVVAMAGYSPTPAEEMPPDAGQQQDEQQPAAAAAPAPATTDQLRVAQAAIGYLVGHETDTLEAAWAALLKDNEDNVPACVANSIEAVARAAVHTRNARQQQPQQPQQ